MKKIMITMGSLATVGMLGYGTYLLMSPNNKKKVKKLTNNIIEDFSVLDKMSS